MDRGDAPGVNQRLPIALTIAGSDSGAGAGIQADLRTFAALGVYGASVVTAVTAQNTRGVAAIHYSPPGIVGAQIEAVLEDFAVAAIKIGMLGSAEIAGVVAERLPSPSSDGRSPERPLGRGGETLLPEGEGGQKGPMRPFIVYDPVMIASSGDALSGAGFVEAITCRLLPLVDCLTPNLAEAAALLGESIAQSEEDMTRQGAALLKLGPRAVLMKGGHLEGREAVDLLVTPQRVRRFSAPRARLAQSARDRLHIVERDSGECCPWDGVAGGRGVGQGFRARGDRAGRPRDAGRWTRPADPGEAALKLRPD